MKWNCFSPWRANDAGDRGLFQRLLHGVLLNGTVWAEVVYALRDRYRCIVPELPFGAHARPMPDGAVLTLKSIARITAEFFV